ncbi:cell division protein SepF [Caldisalinibacter kiritimatiensis]|uniref:Cell division protein SepF n=1 Tax=Caldisalinibacter kiritimatiensis TaxID=1304284 RepID=R1AX92_9FIRM|nr:cell division protein SepF [Caldisalinibacter kiritimatiensis]EOD01287.1 FtsZ-interacting protein [Caldisalinibacter kiritimatiensis]
MTNKIIDKVKNFMGLDEFDEEPIDEMDEMNYIEEYDRLELPPAKKLYKGNKIVNIHTNSQMKLMVFEPRRYEDAPRIVDELKNRKPVVINLEYLNGESRRQVFEFLSGAVYTLEGNMKKVSRDIFILAPSNIDIDGELKEEIRTKGFFSWQK